MKASMMALTLTLAFTTAAFAQVERNQEEAARVCSEKGKKLPTARELALYAESFGGKVSDQKVEGFLYVNASDAPFYFGREGYQSKLQGCYWTASVDTDHPLPYHDYKIIFNADVGRFDNASTMRNAVISCKVKCL